jgi:hypothetical protein
LLVTSASGLSVVTLPSSGHVVLGRDHDCDVVLPHPKVSRQHARLSVGEPTTLADLGSHNGTFLRGAQLAAEQPVGAGDSFTIGGFTLLLLAGGAGASPRPGSASLRVEDPAAAEAEGLIGAIARAPVSVIIRGETGAGKEVLARALHRASGRSGPFLGVNCAALNDSLLESELFGHEKGAFTGAVGRAGLLESTAGGTCSSTRSARWIPGCKPSSSAPSRRARSSASAA